MKQKKQYLNRLNKITLANWWEIQDTMDFILLRSDDTEDTEDVSKEGRDAYIFISDLIIDTFGISPEFKKLLNKKKRYVKLMSKALATENEHDIWKAGKLLKEIEEEEEAESGNTREDTLIIIHDVIGGNPINANEFYLDQYYSYLKHIKKKNGKN